ncbi:MAG TPA: hypothetical protein ACFYD1_04210, partial [Candidatus Hypogeohydataceae bacterium YC38]
MVLSLGSIRGSLQKDLCQYIHIPQALKGLHGSPARRGACEENTLTGKINSNYKQGENQQFFSCIYSVVRIVRFLASLVWPYLLTMEDYPI